MIASDAILHSSHSLFNLKWIAKWAPDQFRQWSFNNAGIHVLSFGSLFEIFSSFVLRTMLW